jgi:hypothetical protein
MDLASKLQASLAPSALALDQLTENQCKIARLYVSSQKKAIASVLQRASLIAPEGCCSITALGSNRACESPLLSEDGALLFLSTQCDPCVSVLTTRPLRGLLDGLQNIPAIGFVYKGFHLATPLRG